MVGASVVRNAIDGRRLHGFASTYSPSKPKGHPGSVFHCRCSIESHKIILGIQSRKPSSFTYGSKRLLKASYSEELENHKTMDKLGKTAVQEAPLVVSHY